jgi:hypothetical protein
MARISLVLSDDVEKRLRLAVVEEYGGRKGDLSQAIEQAVNEWLAKHESKTKRKT